jgi:hypothetical protein
MIAIQLYEQNVLPLIIDRRRAGDMPHYGVVYKLRLPARDAPLRCPISAAAAACSSGNVPISASLASKKIFARKVSHGNDSGFGPGGRSGLLGALLLPIINLLGSKIRLPGRRLVRQHRLDGSPFVVGKFIAHESKLPSLEA